MPSPTINPADLVVNGAPVSESNPLPVTFQPSVGATNPTLNPRTLVIDGAEVDSSHPLTVSFG